MGILSNRRRSGKQWTTIESQRQCKYSINNTLSRNNGYQWRWGSRSNNKFLRLIGSLQYGKFHTIRSGGSFSVYPNIFRTRDDKSDDNSTCHINRKRNKYNQYLYPVAAALLGIVNPSVALAESVGGVSATANPIANSSGSVTNQAIKVLQGPYITNTYGNQISCQSATFNATPYIQYSNSWKDPWESTYMQPQYNNTDFTGRTTTQTVTVKNYPWEDWYDDRVRTDPNDPKYDVDEDGNADRWWNDGDDMQIEVEVDGPDGIPDNPGEVVWNKPVRTDMRANNNFNLGLSATLSIPLDKKLQDLCKQAATTQIAQQQQLTANKRLDFEIARLKNCGELMQKGIMFHPRSPYAAICADVIVSTPPGTIIPHSHTLSRPTFEEDKQENNTSSPSTSVQPEPPQSTPVVSTSDPAPITSAPASLEPSFLQRLWPFSRQVSPPSVEDPPAALLGGPIQWPPKQLPQSSLQSED